MTMKARRNPASSLQPPNRGGDGGGDEGTSPAIPPRPPLISDLNDLQEIGRIHSRRPKEGRLLAA